jgi:Lrp/AsnC family leucine-responsive transcriptional regulator
LVFFISERAYQREIVNLCYDSIVKHTQPGEIVGDLDEKDWIIIKLVQADARVSFAELGRSTGLSAPAAAERLRYLEDAGVVLGYHARINPDRLGLPMLVFIEMQVKRVDYLRFHKAIQKLTWIAECYHVAGRASFVLKAAVPDASGLELLIGHLSQFGDTITSLVLSTVLGRREFSFDGPNRATKTFST